MNKHEYIQMAAMMIAGAQLTPANASAEALTQQSIMAVRRAEALAEALDKKGHHFSGD